MPRGRNLGRRELLESWRSFIQCIFPCCTRKAGKNDSFDLKSTEETMAEAEEEKSCFRKFLSCCCFDEYGRPHAPDYSEYTDFPEYTEDWDNANERTPFKNTNNFTARRVNRAQFIAHAARHIGNGDQLIFYDNEKAQAGLVVWTGYRAEQGQHFDTNLLVVLEVEYKHSLATNGIFEGQVLVGPENHKHYIMVEYKDTRKVPTFEIGDYCIVLDEDISQVNRRNFHGGFITSRIDNSYIFTAINTNFRDDTYQKDNHMYRAHLLRKAPIPESERMSDHVGPICKHHLDRFLGRNKGIQGWHNSCYLDTILFSFFAFSDEFDHILSADHEDLDHNYLMVLNVLRHDIVYPLRACHFVSSQYISELRGMMASRIDRKFEGDNRDIPETMDALFRQLLQVEPFLSIGQSTKDQSYFDGSYTAECIAMDENFPTSELLLENAAVQMDFSFEKMPNCFILQLPRESERDGCVLPSYTLDLKNLLYRSVKMCHRCECNATLQFPYLIVRNRGLAGTFFCEDCAKSLNLDFTKSKELPEPDDMARLADEETEVEMHALICIEKSHYNCYVRCGERWVFFDSMSDQETLEDPATHKPKTFNIPLVEEVPNFRRWIKEAHRNVRERDSLHAFFSSLGPQNQLERAQRIFRFPYCIIYRKI